MQICRLALVLCIVLCAAALASDMESEALPMPESIEEEHNFLDAPIDRHAFTEPPLFLRPHFVAGGPVAAREEAEALIKERLEGRAQGGITVQPHWSRWNDPTLFTEQDGYWQHVRTTLEVVSEFGGFAWAYDEPGYPSGSIGMRVLQGHPELQARGIACYWEDAQEQGEVELELPEGEFLYACRASVTSSGIEPASLTPIDAAPLDGKLRATVPSGPCRVMAFVVEPLYKGTFTYLRRAQLLDEKRYTGEPPHWQDPIYAYPNLLDRRAAERFIEVGYEPYARHAGEYLGPVLRAFFTDEPLAPKREVHADELGPIVPWFPELLERFEAANSYSLVPKLPFLFFDGGGSETTVRCDYYDLIADTFAADFMRPLADWCTSQGVYLTGHLLGEEFLAHHAAHYGSLMRVVREMTLPGIDQLGAGFVGRSLMHTPSLGHTSTFGALTPKLVSSAAHLEGRPRTMSESHGFCSASNGTTWSDFIATANWQVVLGINTLPYYGRGWVDQTPEQYRHYSQYAGRLNYLTAGGSHRADIAMLYPIASVWARFSPATARSDNFRREEWVDAQIDFIQSTVDDTARALLERQLDFDFFDEEDLHTAVLENSKIRIGQETFSAIVVPAAEVLDIESIRKLDTFQDQGGVLVLAGQKPAHARRGEHREELTHIVSSWSSRPNVLIVDDPVSAIDHLASAIEPTVALDPSFSGIYALHREKGASDVFLFANNSDKEWIGKALLRVAGVPTLWNAWNGKIYPLDSKPRKEGAEVSLEIAGKSACFVVVSPEPETELESDLSDRWSFGPPATGVAGRLRWGKGDSLRHIGSGPHAKPAIGNPVQAEWALRAPDGVLTLSQEDDELRLGIQPWRRLGNVYEGLQARLTLPPGDYVLQAEIAAENLEMWCILPKHWGSDGELFDATGFWLEPRHHLCVPGPHDWQALTFYFRVPEGAKYSNLLFFPVDKVYFSQPAAFRARELSVAPLETLSEGAS